MSADLAEMLLAAALLLSGAIHLLPVSGAVSAQRLRILYGVEIGDPTLLLLLRHRALLFGVLGLGLVTAAFVPAWRPGAAGMALFSMLSFVALAGSNGGEAIRRAVRVDLILSAVLILSLASRLLAAG